MIFECDMSIVAIKWNHNGNVLALVGSLIIDGDVKESNVLQLYSPFGEVSFNYSVTYSAPHRFIYIKTCLSKWNLPYPII